MKRNKKGFTLIELLAVIVVLAIIALIATPIVLNLVEKARKGAFTRSAEGVLKASKLVYTSNMVSNPSVETEIYECKDNICLSNKLDENNKRIPLNINGTVGNGMIKIHQNGEIEFTLSNGKYCAIKHKEEQGITVEDGDCSNADLREYGKVTLSSTSGNYTYPETKTFEVIENKSGGALTCASSDEEIATCSINETTVTVEAGTKEGIADITITSLGTAEYKEATAVYVATTLKGTLNSIVASGYTGIYDGNAYGITVTSDNSIIKYGTSKGTYDLNESPTYTDVGEYTVYYEVTKAGYNTVEGSKTVVITKAEGNINLEEFNNKIEYNTEKEIEIKENKSNGNITVTSSDSNIVEALYENGKIKIKGKNVGSATITISSEATNNYNNASTNYELEVIKANNVLTLSSTNGSYTYPETGIFEVTENLSGGTLSCETNKASVADCTISNNIVTVVPGTEEGAATLTIKSASTNNYNEGQITYVATTLKGTLNSISASGYSGVYDGKAYGITVTNAGATIKYGTTKGTYDKTTSPTYTDVGTYTVYYQVEKAGYNTVEGEKQVIITKAEGTVTAPTALSLTYTGSAQALIKAGISNTGTIKYKLEGGTYSTSIPTGTNAGTYKVYYMVEGDSNHNNVSEKSIEVKINKASGAATLSSTSGEVQVSKTTTFTVNNATGTISGCTSSNTSIATCLVSGTTVTVRGIAAGSATITVNVAASTNYNATSKKYTSIVKQVLSKQVKLGDYVSMTPTSTLYTISRDATGEWNDQTINPSELNLWRVININSDGTIEMVSEYTSSQSVSFSGSEGYKNFVGTLNTIAAQYTNSKYVQSTRHMGYNGQTEFLADVVTNSLELKLWPSDTIDNSKETLGGGDILYEKDVNLVKKAIGTLAAIPAGKVETSNYWLASRHLVIRINTNYTWVGRWIDSDGLESGQGIFFIAITGSGGGGMSRIRPIVTLKSSVMVSNGNGTSTSPWVLS